MQNTKAFPFQQLVHTAILIAEIAVQMARLRANRHKHGVAIVISFKLVTLLTLVHARNHVVKGQTFPFMAQRLTANRSRFRQRGIGFICIPHIGQCAPARWTMLSAVLMHCYRLEGFGARLLSPISRLLIEFMGTIFVDDTDLVIMDPPTFSNSKRMKDFLDIQRIQPIF